MRYLHIAAIISLLLSVPFAMWTVTTPSPESRGLYRACASALLISAAIYAVLGWVTR